MRCFRFRMLELKMSARAIDGVAQAAGGLVAEGMRTLDETTAAPSGAMRDAELIASTCRRSDPGSCRSSRSGCSPVRRSGALDAAGWAAR